MSEYIDSTDTSYECHPDWDDGDIVLLTDDSCALRFKKSILSASRYVSFPPLIRAD